MLTPEAFVTIAWLYFFVLITVCVGEFVYRFKPTARIIRKFFPELYEGYKEF